MRKDRLARKHFDKSPGPVDIMSGRKTHKRSLSFLIELVAKHELSYFLSLNSAFLSVWSEIFFSIAQNTRVF